MSFDSLAAFLHMGGHALYVWLAFGVTGLALAVNLFNLSRCRHKALEDARYEALMSGPIEGDAQT